jgi:Uncharacterized protein conserved in bacteria (DUF2252)
VFDINDFDETLPDPFEWDVKRLAASFVVAGRDNGFTKKQSRTATLATVESYRTAMQGFAAQPILAVRYAHLNIEDSACSVTSPKSTSRTRWWEWAALAPGHRFCSSKAESDGESPSPAGQTGWTIGPRCLCGRIGVSQPGRACGRPSAPDAGIE